MNKKQYIVPTIKAKALSSAPLLDQISGTRHDAVVTPDPSTGEGGAREVFQDVNVWGEEE